MNRIRIGMTLAMVTLAGAAWSAELRTEHTYQLAPDEPRPAATLDDASWLVGSWSGTAFGGTFEEVWNAPSAGTMVGLFKLYGDDGVAFYEILLLSIEEGTLSLKVKLHFGGLSFYRRGDDAIDGYIVMRNGEDIQEHHLKYQRR